MIQELFKNMKKNNFGRIINVGTNLFQNPVVPYHDYIIAKSGLLGLTRSFAKDLGEFGITVNMISGGLLKVTDASAATWPPIDKIIKYKTIGERTGNKDGTIISLIAATVNKSTSFA